MPLFIHTEGALAAKVGVVYQRAAPMLAGMAIPFWQQAHLVADLDGAHVMAAAPYRAAKLFSPTS